VEYTIAKLFIENLLNKDISIKEMKRIKEKRSKLR
jgi:hypothetical protein